MNREDGKTTHGDVWRERHDNEIGWACQSKKKRVKTRVKTRQVADRSKIM